MSDKADKEGRSYIEITDEKMFGLYQEALKRGDSTSAKLYLDYVMEFCPHKLKN